MPTLSFDKEKYTRIAKSEGVSAALTQLHKDTIQWEHQAFEGEGGFAPKMWEALHEVRNFARELWALDLKSSPEK